jgi:hypothetical protein
LKETHAVTPTLYFLEKLHFNAKFRKNHYLAQNWGRQNGPVGVVVMGVKSQKISKFSFKNFFSLLAKFWLKKNEFENSMQLSTFSSKQMVHFGDKQKARFLVKGVKTKADQTSSGNVRCSKD